MRARQREKLRAILKGRLIVPGESSYESARRVFYWNPKTERSPVAIVQCGHEDDVLRAVEFARTQALEVSVGLVIDLSPLKQITIDPKKRLARTQAGALSSEVAHAAEGLVPAKVCRVKPDATAFPNRQAHSIHLHAAYRWNDSQNKLPDLLFPSQCKHRPCQGIKETTHETRRLGYGAATGAPRGHQQPTQRLSCVQERRLRADRAQVHPLERD